MPQTASWRNIKDNIHTCPCQTDDNDTYLSFRCNNNHKLAQLHYSRLKITQWKWSNSDGKGWMAKKTAASWAYRLAAIIFARGTFYFSFAASFRWMNCQDATICLNQLQSGPLDSFLFQYESVVHLYDRPLECEKRSTASTESIIFVKCRDI